MNGDPEECVLLFVKADIKRESDVTLDLLTGEALLYFPLSHHLAPLIPPQLLPPQLLYYFTSTWEEAIL